MAGATKNRLETGPAIGIAEPAAGMARGTKTKRRVADRIESTTTGQRGTNAAAAKTGRAPRGSRRTAGIAIGRR
jgi:hypothetical protein